LYATYKDRVTFIGVYLSEAHASDEWPINNKLQIAQHKTLQDRVEAATKFYKENGFALPLYLDTMENSFHTLFGAWPERYFIIDKGKLALMGQPGPLGYNTANWPEEIEKWLTQKFKWSFLF